MASRRVTSLLRTLDSLRGPGNIRAFNSLVSSHTAKWMQVKNFRLYVPGQSINLLFISPVEMSIRRWGSLNYDPVEDTSKKSPMELINEVPPIKVEGRIVSCEGDINPALGHPIEFICLDLKDPAICKYCGLRYVQHDHHH